MLLNPVDPSSFSPIDGFSPSRSLFKRCITCDSVPTCPACPDGQTCTMTAQTCDTCSTTKCVSSSTNSSPPSSSGPNVGAIAGGVVGAVLALTLILFLIWWFVIRKRRNDAAEGEEKDHSAFNAARDGRKSIQSIASTVLTRASNVIQIAYIPGVTNRSPPETPATLVPPVPPLPGAHPDQHFFMPGDLRDSSWTTMTGHQSMSPTFRSSVATTVYRSDAIVSAIPAQQIQRSRANIVSVHNAPPGGVGSGSPTQPLPVMITPRDAPAVPAITTSQLAKAGAMQHGGSSIVARQVVAKPVMVRGASVKKKDGQADKKPITTESNGSSHQFDHQMSTFDGNSSDEDENGDETRPTTSSNSTGAKATASEESAQSSGPFQDPLSSDATSSSESQQRSSRHTDGAPPRVQSPFSDANEVK
ncbi:Membrane anchor Opy2 N-terminal [Penicillium canariense]|uniref:Membrane anchor Opy2 N-terminal n=1 Tax=Penicillium canariense TaxID=189055 RepID=A0A9W9HRY4_9EURO|nr:Membrane anchor Opy2 N-terminal [Penicillium canariense]KAJ5153520.1 Membrane anchor Opy2 N-terminal [Penicillium canariense]